MTDVQITDNTTTVTTVDGQAAVATYANNTAAAYGPTATARGAGIYNGVLTFDQQIELRISDSTITGNVATTSPGSRATGRTSAWGALAPADRHVVTRPIGVTVSPVVGTLRMAAHRAPSDEGLGGP